MKNALLILILVLALGASVGITVKHTLLDQSFETHEAEE
jgi:hypothetical protein